MPISKTALEHGAYYQGNSRNARVARWNAETGHFEYMRRKFGNRFWEEDTVDDFTPEKKLEVPDVPPEYTPSTRNLKSNT